MHADLIKFLYPRFSLDFIGRSRRTLIYLRTVLRGKTFGRNVVYEADTVERAVRIELRKRLYVMACMAALALKHPQITQ